MISPERLERYSDFVDPEKRGVPYDPRQGLERLMGVLSPDPKGIVLDAMGQDWYGSKYQLQSRIFSFLEELGLPSGIWPLTLKPSWEYIEYNNKAEEIVDGSLVNLGAVVQKIEQDPFQRLYQRSLAGAELVVPFIQQAVRFVSKAREYAEAQRLKGKIPHKFDSMWRIIGSINSSTETRVPLAIFDIIDFLVHNPGKQIEKDFQNQTQISQSRLTKLLPSLGDCGVVDYISPQTEKEGQRSWAIYTLVNPSSVVDLNPDELYQNIRNMKSGFHKKTALAKIIDYIKEYPNDKYEYSTLVEKLNIRLEYIRWILPLLADLSILKRPDSGRTTASANDLTYLFYDLVCAPAKAIADTLSPLPLSFWKREEVAIYLQNYNEERSRIGPQGGDDARRLLVEILSQAHEEIKLSHLVDLYNDRAERELKPVSISGQLKRLLVSGLLEQPKPGYYRLAQKQNL